MTNQPTNVRVDHRKKQKLKENEKEKVLAQNIDIRDLIIIQKYISINYLYSLLAINLYQFYNNKRNTNVFSINPPSMFLSLLPQFLSIK